MGFGRGKGFTAIKTSFTGSGLVTTVSGYWRFILVRNKLFSSRVSAASGTSSGISTSGKLEATRTRVVT